MTTIVKDCGCLLFPSGTMRQPCEAHAAAYRYREERDAAEDNPMSSDPLEHHVEITISDDRSTIGWHCLTCGHIAQFAAVMHTWAAVEDDAEHHRRIAHEHPGSYLPLAGVPKDWTPPKGPA